MLKRDVFSESRLGHLAADPETRVVRRIVTASPWWSRPVAWFLANREIRALKAVDGLSGVPHLIFTDRDGLCRDWTEGTPLHLARPSGPQYYRDAHRLLKTLRARGVTHNDIAKPQNWLVAPDGGAALIDFQLASVHRRKSGLFRLMAREDLRHLLKQKRSFAPEHLTPIEKRLLSRKSLPSRLWLATGKKVYNFVTRRLLDWSDGEGTGDRLDNEGPEITARLKGHKAVTDLALLTYSQPAHGVGIYAFVEVKPGTKEADLRKVLSGMRVEHLQPVAALPRDDDGRIRLDLLSLIALNQMTELDRAIADEPRHGDVLRDLAADRRNFSDRRDTEMEARGGHTSPA